MYTLARDVTLTPAEYGAVLLHHHTGRYWVMNDTGTAVLQEVLDSGSINNAVDRLVREFPDTTRDVIEGHSRALIETLVTAGMVAT